jgi:hypothetical protein
MAKTGAPLTRLALVLYQGVQGAQMPFNLKKQPGTIFTLAAYLIVPLLMLYAFYRVYQLVHMVANDPAYWPQALTDLILILAIGMLTGVGALLWILYQRFQYLHATQSWLIDVVQYQGQKLGAFEPEDKLAENLALSIPAIGGSLNWPWGRHHTEYLGHLDAAARKWWHSYEPSDPSTAPTNEIVADWLRNERGISKEKARAIASMLRPDGLPTGPR